MKTFRPGESLCLPARDANAYPVTSPHDFKDFPRAHFQQTSRRQQATTPGCARAAYWICCELTSPAT
jgi:hypothetical protein